MLKKMVVIAAVLAAQGGIVVGLSGVADAAPALTGHVTCTTFAGSGTLHPALTATGSAGGVKITFTGKLAGCSGASIGGGGAIHTVSGGAVKGSGSFNGTSASACGNFEGVLPADTVNKIKMKVTWNLSPPFTVAPSHVKYTAGPYSAPVSGTTMALQLGNPVSTPTAVTGSFAGSTSQDTLMNINVPAGGCPVGTSFTFSSGQVTF
jgi:hypothetical protein